jgi:hypothetical protein
MSSEIGPLATSDAIAFLGNTLVALLEDGLAGFSPPVNVLLSTPDDVKNSPPDPPAVTIILYQVGICGERRNVPRRSLNGGFSRRPPLPLDLRFLITPWVKLKQPQDAYKIVGTIAQLFYDRAVLHSADLLSDPIHPTWAPDDTVEIVMESLPVSDHYDIWEPTEIPYRLSLTYLARIVGIDSAVTTDTAPVTVATFSRVAP